MPELQTLFTIPPRATRLHNLLQLPPVRAVLAALGGDIPDTAAFRAILNNLVAQNFLQAPSAEEILNHPWDEIQVAIGHVLTPVNPGYPNLVQEEFDALQEASTSGYPPIHTAGPSSPVVFEVIPQQVAILDGPLGLRFRVTPVSRLRTVTVQTGYRRMSELGRLVSNGFTGDDGQTWLPGVEHLGEGLFSSLAEESRLTLGDLAEAWRQAGAGTGNYPDGVFRGGARSELDPLFVWWHTLSHGLIRQIAVDSGYSSASIRERVYLSVTDWGSEGGIILYTVQPGADGTLGGLIALVPNFGDLLQQAVDELLICSNDPLCGETRFSPGSYNGSACYACLLVSETSCEHRNMWLDRMLFLEAHG